MTFATDSRFDIEVLEPLLLMSASSLDCDPTDFSDAADAIDSGEPVGGDAAIEAVDGDGESLFTTTQEGRLARCWGDRADYTVEDQGYGIYAVKNGDCVEFVVDIEEIQFRDGCVPVCELVTENGEVASVSIVGSESVEAADPAPELEQSFVAPIELLVLAEDVPDGATEPPPVVDGPPEVADETGYFPLSPDDIDPPPASVTPVDGVDPVPPPEVDLTITVDVLTEDVWFAEGQPADPAAETGQIDPAELTIAELPVADDCPPNTVPDAQDDELSTVQDLSMSGTVAANDSDADGDTLMFFVEEGPASGSLEFENDGSYIYTPDPGFSGDDSFTYEVNDGNGGTDVAEVCIHITAGEECVVIVPDLNEPPVAVDDANSTLQDTAVSGSVSVNDSDADGDALMYFVDVGPVNGSIVLNQDGTYTYTPDPGFRGTDWFTYEVNDGNGGTDIAEVCIDVTAVDECVLEPDPNQPPDAVDDGFTTQEDTPFSGTVASNDSDPDGDTLVFFVEEGPVNGSIVFNQNGSYTYTPDPGFSGTDSFTYEANDGEDGTDVATVSIVVESAPNDAPIAVKDYNTLTSCEVLVAGNVLENDSDANCDGLTVTLMSTASNGTVTLDSDGNYTYTPDAGFIGHDVFTYEVSDGNGGTAVAEVCIEVTEYVNETVTAVDDVNQTDFETAVSDNVLTNDTDSYGDALVATLVTGTSNGTVTLDADGSYTYTPNPGFSGQDTFTYEITDQDCGTDTAVVTIDVAPDPNEAPTAVDDVAETCEDHAVEGNVLANDVDVDGDALTASPLTDVQTSEGGIVTLHEDGSFVYMPAAGYSGVDTFVYSMSDGSGGTATATVTITVHDIPEPQDDMFAGEQGEAISGNVVLNDGTVDGSQPVVIVDSPANGTVTLNADGTFNYVPNDGFFGEDSFTYAINGDCGPSAEANVRLVVTKVNWNTTIVSSGNGRVWGDPHFEGDDGGLYDVQGEAGHIYNLLSDRDLQVNALFVPWEGHEGSTMVGAVGATIETDLIQADFDGTQVNGVAMLVGEVRTITKGTVEFDGEYTTITTDEYEMRFRKREGWFDTKLKSLDPFADNVAPHGLWGLTVDGDSDARHGDYFKDEWNYTLQGGGALDTVDVNGNVVVSQRGDDTAYKLYEVANLFSTDALNSAGEVFFRFNAKQGTGLNRV